MTLTSLPNDFNVVDDLGNSFQAGHCGLGKLLVIKTGHLTPQEETAIAHVAPDPLGGQMRLLRQPGAGGRENAPCFPRIAAVSMGIHENFPALMWPAGLFGGRQRWTWLAHIGHIYHCGNVAEFCKASSRGYGICAGRDSIARKKRSGFRCADKRPYWV